MNWSAQARWVVGFMTLALAPGANAQMPGANPSSTSLRWLNSSLEQVTASVSTAVVHIEVTGYVPWGGEDDEGKLQTLTKQRGSGSGVIVDSDGYIVTAYHVVEGARRIRVELDPRIQPKRAVPAVGENGRNLSFPAKMIGFFKDADLAVLKIEVRDLPTVKFSDSANLRQGQLVVSLGSPEGLRNSLALGIVSSASQQIEPDDSMAYIQTDAALAPGNSGGPLINVEGEVVGIDLFTLTEGGKEFGLGFAIPGTMVRFVYEQIRQSGAVRRAYLGADVQGITPTLASALQLPVDSGVIISGAAASPPHHTSLQAGDVLLSVDGEQVRNVPHLTWILLHKHPGDQVKVEVSRSSGKLVFDLPLIDAPSNPDDMLASIDLEENLLAKLGIVGSAQTPGSSPGVLVLRRVRGSTAQPELAVGDVIRSVNAVPVTSVEQLRAMVDGYKLGDAVALQVERKGKLTYLTFEMD